jgi:eukaryotic-like serine/threonine-protein kinase
MLSIGDMIRGHYSISRRVAVGDFGDIYQALDIRTQKQVAIKEIFPGNISGDVLKETAENFYNEINYLRSLNHPNLAKFFEGFEINGTYYYVTSWMEGKNLEELISERKKPLEGKHLIPLFYLLLDMIIFFHSSEIPYTLRLLRPSDILVDENGNITIVDLGVAMDFMPSKTPTGYWEPDETADSTRDVYHAGSVIYELLTGIKPGSASPGSLPAVYEVNDKVPRSLSDIVMKCVAERRERLKYASGVRTELMRWFPEYNKFTNITGERPLEEDLLEKQTQIAVGNFTCLGLIILISLLVILGIQHQENLTDLLSKIWSGRFFPFNI